MYSRRKSCLSKLTYLIISPIGVLEVTIQHPDGRLQTDQKLHALMYVFKLS